MDWNKLGHLSCLLHHVMLIFFHIWQIWVICKDISGTSWCEITFYHLSTYNYSLQSVGSFAEFCTLLHGALYDSIIYISSTWLMTFAVWLQHKTRVDLWESAVTSLTANCVFHHIVLMGFNLTFAVFLLLLACYNENSILLLWASNTNEQCDRNRWGM